MLSEDEEEEAEESPGIGALIIGLGFWAFLTIVIVLCAPKPY